MALGRREGGCLDDFQKLGALSEGIIFGASDFDEGYLIPGRRRRQRRPVRAGVVVFRNSREQEKRNWPKGKSWSKRLLVMRLSYRPSASVSIRGNTVMPRGVGRNEKICPNFKGEGRTSDIAMAKRRLNGWLGSLWEQ
jgi:hypothetical protein